MARTTTVGGTTSGYSLIGSWNSEIAPTMKMRIERTPAKIGRLMKKSEMFMGVREKWAKRWLGGPARARIQCGWVVCVGRLAGSGDLGATEDGSDDGGDFRSE